MLRNILWHLPITVNRMLAFGSEQQRLGMLAVLFACMCYLCESPVAAQAPNSPISAARNAEKLTVEQVVAGFRKKGQFKEAMQFCDEGLKANQKHPKTPLTAWLHALLGLLHDDLNDYVQSRSHFEQATAIASQFPQLIGGSVLANWYLAHGNAAYMLADYRSAEVSYKASLSCAVNDRSSATAHVKLGDLYYRLGNFVAANEQVERLLMLFDVEPEDGSDPDPDLEYLKLKTWALQFELGSVLRETGTSSSDTTKWALPSLPPQKQILYEVYLRRKMQGIAAAEGEEPIGFADLHDLVGAVKQQLGADVAARHAYEKALKLRLKRLGSEHLETTRSYNLLASLEAQFGNWENAAKWRDLERRAVRRRIAEILPMLNEAEQLNFLHADFRERTSLSLALAFQHRQHTPLVEQAAGWLLNSKGTTHEALARQTLKSRSITDSRLNPVVEDLRRVREELSRICFAADGAEQEATQQRRANLAIREAQLAKQLSTNGEKYSVGDDVWTELSAVRKSLPLNSCLIEVAKFDRWVFGSKTSAKKHPPHYAAFVIPRAEAGDVAMVDLGPAETIEHLVDGWRRLIEQAPEEQDGAAIRAATGDLSRQLWNPLAPYIQDSKRLFLSPDGPLWLIPWAALTNEEGRPLIEDYTTSYLVSGRDLARVHAKRPSAPPVIFANPDYDLSPEQAAVASKAVLRKEPSGISSTGWNGKLSIGRVASLPITKVEALAISSPVAQCSQSQPTIYSEAFALESIAKRLSSPSIAVFATHGFFVGDRRGPAKRYGTEESADLRATTLNTSQGNIGNPLLQCGLLFSGCNPRINGQAGSDEDGILSGMEILGIQFRGTDLVVLSACQSGVGKISAGEGVSGLRHAFQLAGARKVVSTLWQIPDRDSTIIMTDFFEHLAGGKSPAESLRLAQLNRMKSRTEKYGAAHPFYWSAWTVTGN